MRYSKPQIILHWLILLLIAITYSAIELKGFIPKPNPWHNYVKIIHFNTGIWVLVLMLVRVNLKRNMPPLLFFRHHRHGKLGYRT